MIKANDVWRARVLSKAGGVTALTAAGFSPEMGEEGIQRLVLRGSANPCLGEVCRMAGEALAQGGDS